MGNVFTTASTILCGPIAPKLHGGTVQTASAEKLTVAGQAVLVEKSLGKVVGCKTVPPPPPQTACKNVLKVIPNSVATKLLANGSGVLLEVLTGATDGVPPGNLGGSQAGQTKLVAV